MRELTNEQIKRNLMNALHREVKIRNEEFKQRLKNHWNNLLADQLGIELGANGLLDCQKAIIMDKLRESREKHKKSMDELFEKLDGLEASFLYSF